VGGVWWVYGRGLVSVIDMDGRRGSCLQPKCVLHNFKASLKPNAITGCDFVTETISRISLLFFSVAFLEQIEFHSSLNIDGVEREIFHFPCVAYVLFANLQSANNFDQFLCNYFLPIRGKLIN